MIAVRGEDIGTPNNADIGYFRSVLGASVRLET